jgi:AraC-like DNA-binding protein
MGKEAGRRGTRARSGRSEERGATFEIAERSVEPNGVIRAGRGAALVFITEGRAEIGRNGGTRGADFGQCFLLRPGGCLDVEKAASLRTMSIGFDLGLLHQMEGRGGTILGERVTVVDRSGALARPAGERRLSVVQIQTIRTLAQGLRRDEAAGYWFLKLSKFFSILHVIAEGAGDPLGASGRRLHPVAAALQHIQENYTREISPAELRGVCGVSKSILYREFKRQTGFSPGRYQTHLRLAAARRLLEEGLDNVTEVAYRVGFADSNYFTKQFSRYMSIPPARYRKQWRTIRGPAGVDNALSCLSNEGLPA